MNQALGTCLAWLWKTQPWTLLGPSAAFLNVCHGTVGRWLRDQVTPAVCIQSYWLSIYTVDCSGNIIYPGSQLITFNCFMTSHCKGHTIPVSLWFGHCCGSTEFFCFFTPYEDYFILNSQWTFLFAWTFWTVISFVFVLWALHFSLNLFDITILYLIVC